MSVDVETGEIKKPERVISKYPYTDGTSLWLDWKREYKESRISAHEYLKRFREFQEMLYSGE